MVSIVWTFFNKLTDKVKCKICGHEIFYKTGSSTSNMIRHLKAKHPFDYEKEKAKEKRPGKRNYKASNAQSKEANDDTSVIMTSTTRGASCENQTSSEETASSECAVPATVPDKNVQKKSKTQKTVQDTLPKSLTRNIPYKDDSQRKKTLDQKVLDLIVIDMQPLSVVEDKAFRSLMHEMDPKYKIISRKQLTQVLLPSKYEMEKASLMSRLNQVENLAVTTDQWSSRNNEGYTTITAHFIDDNWNIHSPVLMTRHKPQRHTAINLANELAEAFEEFQIKDKVTAVVTDNAPNITSAVSKLDQVEDRQACFAHTLNLCVQHAIKNDETTQKVVKRVKDIVSFFRSSNQAVDELKEVHALKKSKFYKLKQDVETRWNSTYIMLESFEKQRVAVTTVLGNRGKLDAILTDTELQQLTETLAVLKPFFQITTEISAENHTSISKIIPMIIIMENFLTSQKSSLSTELKDQLDSCFKETGNQRFATFATFLDPRFKDKMFKEDQKLVIKQELTKYMEDKKPQEEEKTTKETNKEAKETTSTEETQENAFKFWATFDKETEEELDIMADVSAIDLEMSRYLEGRRCARETNILKWWKENEKYFPNMSTVAKKYLCIPATSVPSERVFSKAGEIVSARRSRIKSKNVDMILFLNKLQNGKPTETVHFY